ncbi:MAG: hypothetical protein K0S56_4806 [Microvirga sp.]|nr:hypothetical protein [Microvirga sp.]
MGEKRLPVGRRVRPIAAFIPGRFGHHDDRRSLGIGHAGVRWFLRGVFRGLWGAGQTLDHGARRRGSYGRRIGVLFHRIGDQRKAAKGRHPFVGALLGSRRGFRLEPSAQRPRDLAKSIAFRIRQARLRLGRPRSYRRLRFRLGFFVLGNVLVDLDGRLREGGGHGLAELLEQLFLVGQVALKFRLWGGHVSLLRYLRYHRRGRFDLDNFLGFVRCDDLGFACLDGRRSTFLGSQSLRRVRKLCQGVFWNEAEPAESDEFAIRPEDRHAGPSDRHRPALVIDPPRDGAPTPGFLSGKKPGDIAGILDDRPADLSPGPAKNIARHRPDSLGQAGGHVDETGLRIGLPYKPDAAARPGKRGFFDLDRRRSRLLRGGGAPCLWQGTDNHRHEHLRAARKRRETTRAGHGRRQARRVQQQALEPNADMRRQPVGERFQSLPRPRAGIEPSSFIEKAGRKTSRGRRRPQQPLGGFIPDKDSSIGPQQVGQGRIVTKTRHQCLKLVRSFRHERPRPLSVEEKHPLRKVLEHYGVQRLQGCAPKAFYFVITLMGRD